MSCGLPRLSRLPGIVDVQMIGSGDYAMRLWLDPNQLASRGLTAADVFVQVGLVVLMGLACKNAILNVEFARELELQGKSIVEAALEACRMRLRPIVMTSIAFIGGSIPLLLGHGAGSEVRAATGITVFSGMLGVTLFGLFLTPVFYVALRTWTKKEFREEWEESREEREKSNA
jgi:multidrug efflux pump subunit AcrB